MTDQDQIDRAAAEAFKAIQAKVRADHGSNAQPLIVVYAIESFLRRLALSEYAGRMYLKGGMLMAANSIREMTRDADLSSHGVSNDQDDVKNIVAEIAALTPDPHDGIDIDPETIRAEVMREDAEYHGVRCKLRARLGQAQIPFSLDFSFGDPGEPVTIELDSIIDRPGIELQAYPLTLNLAEKIVTIMQRRETSTRDRDFADLWVTSRVLDIDATELRGHVVDVAGHRQQPVINMTLALQDMPDRQQPYAAMLERMSYLSPPPETWRELIADVITFIDPLIDDDSGGRLDHWDHKNLKWIRSSGDDRPISEQTT